MWQVMQASGRRASAGLKRWRVWQESHLPSSSPTRWQPPHPFIPSIRACGGMAVVGMEIIAPQATECLPCENCSNFSGWQTAQLRGETRRRTRLSSQAEALVENSRGRFLHRDVAVGAGHALFRMLAQLPVANGAARNIPSPCDMVTRAAFLGRLGQSRLARRRNISPAPHPGEQPLWLIRKFPPTPRVG